MFIAIFYVADNRISIESRFIQLFALRPIISKEPQKRQGGISNAIYNSLQKMVREIPEPSHFKDYQHPNVQNLMCSHVVTFHSQKPLLYRFYSSTLLYA